MSNDERTFIQLAGGWLVCWRPVLRAKAVIRAANKFGETGFTRYSSAPRSKVFSTIPG